MPDHLIQKKGESTWYVRLSVPADVRRAFGGKKVMIASTKTGLRSEAMERRLPILAEWKAAIAAAREKRTEGAWREEAATVGREMAATQKAMRRAAIGEEMPPPSAETEEWLQQPKIQAIIAELAKSLDSTDVMGRLELAEDFAMLGRELEAIRLADEYEADATEVGATIADPSSYKLPSPITTAMIKEFRKFNVSQGKELRTLDNLESKVTNLSNFLKEKQLPLNFDSVVAWFAYLKVKPQTLKQYQWAGRMFWTWATKYHECFRNEYKGQVNPFKEHDIPKLPKQEKLDAREHFNVEDVQKIHKAASPKLAQLIKIGAYTGARIEEICQIRVEDLVTIDGVYAIDFEKTKTAAGIRILPAHPDIIPLLERLKTESQDGYLIPTAEGGKYTRRSHYLSGRFSELKIKLGFGRTHTFHSLRHTLTTQLEQAGVPENVAADIVGHKKKTMTYGLYSGGTSLALRYEAMCKIKGFGLD